MSVAVLFARRDSIYKTLTGVDVFDADRDARTWQGGCSIVAHPPCRAWGQLRHFAKPRPGERRLTIWALAQVRRFGGVLEHPYRSQIFERDDMPAVGHRDAFGGWLLPVTQHWWGHKAEKKTRLYVCGVDPRDIPAFPLRLGEATHTIGLYSGRDRDRCKPDCPKADREHTPPLLAQWLVDLASLCVVDRPGVAA